MIPFKCLLNLCPSYPGAQKDGDPSINIMALQVPQIVFRTNKTLSEIKVMVEQLTLGIFDILVYCALFLEYTGTEEQV